MSTPNEMDFHAALLPQKSAKGLPAGLGFLASILLWIATSVLIAKFVPSLSSQAGLLVGALVGLGGGIAVYRISSGVLRRERARLAQEMQRNRAAETDKQIAEMKHMAAKAEGTE